MKFFLVCQCSLQGKYLIKIQVKNGEDITPITDVIKQEIHDFTIIVSFF